jgi:hypothetical protein
MSLARFPPAPDDARYTITRWLRTMRISGPMRGAIAAVDGFRRGREVMTLTSLRAGVAHAMSLLAFVRARALETRLSGGALRRCITKAHLPSKHALNPRFGARIHRVRALARRADFLLKVERRRKLEAHRAARNQSDYRGIPVSDAVAAACIEDRRRLLVEVRTWLAAHRADLI